MALQSNKGCIYSLMKILNDLNSIGKGKPGKRLGRRTTGKISGKIQRKLWK